MFNQKLEDFLLKQGYVHEKQLGDKGEIELPEDINAQGNRIFPNIKTLNNYLKILGFQDEYIPYIYFRDDKFYARIYTRN